MPDGRLTVLVRGGDASRSVLPRMQDAGIDISRVTLLDNRDTLEHLARFNQIDVSLDTFPYGGHVTTHDSLWMGVPVIAMKGSTPVGRAGACILAHVGLSDLVAESGDAYVKLAVELAKNETRRIELRSQLRARMLASPLTDAKRFTRNLEAGYRLAWRRWCEGLPPDHIDVK